MDGVLVNRAIYGQGMGTSLHGFSTSTRTIRPFKFSSAERHRTMGSVAHGLHSDVGTVHVTIVPIRAIKSIPTIDPKSLRFAPGFLVNRTMHHVS